MPKKIRIINSSSDEDIGRDIAQHLREYDVDALWTEWSSNTPKVSTPTGAACRDNTALPTIVLCSPTSARDDSFDSLTKMIGDLVPILIKDANIAHHLPFRLSHRTVLEYRDWESARNPLLRALGIDVAEPSSPDLIPFRPVRTMSSHAGFVHSVAYTPDGRFAVSAGQDGTLKHWDVDDGRLIQTLRRPPQLKEAQTASGLLGRIFGSGAEEMSEPDPWAVTPIFAVAVLPDGKCAVSGDGFPHDPTAEVALRLWDLSNGEQIRSFANPEGAILDVAVAPDGEIVATTSEKARSISLWDLKSGSPVRVLGPIPNMATALCFAPVGQSLAACGNDGVVRIWDLRNPDKTSAVIEQAAFDVCFAPDGSGLIVLGSSLELWPADGTGPLWTAECSGGQCVDVAADGRRAAIGFEDGTIRLWDVAEGRALAAFSAGSERIQDVMFSPDGRSLLSASFDRTVKLWDVGSL